MIAARAQPARRRADLSIDVFGDIDEDEFAVGERRHREAVQIEDRGAIRRADALAFDFARFIDYFGSTDMIVASSASNDDGLFETNLRDDRFLPFEGAGAVNVWNLSLPTAIQSFDHGAISDVIPHIRCTARSGGDALGTRRPGSWSPRSTRPAQCRKR